MVELSPLSDAWREAVRNNLRDYIGHAVKACPDQAERLREAQRVAFELTSIMAGNPDSGSFRLRQLVDQLDRAAAHFEAVASELEADSPLQALHLGQAASVISDAAFYYHCPEQSQPGGWAQTHGGDFGKPPVMGAHILYPVLQAGDDLARADYLLSLDESSGSGLRDRQAQDRAAAYGTFKAAVEAVAGSLPPKLAEELLAYSHDASGIAGPVDPKAWRTLKVALQRAAATRPAVPVVEVGEPQGGDTSASGGDDAEPVEVDPPKRRGRRRKDPTNLTAADKQRVLLYLAHQQQQADKGEADWSKLADQFGIKWRRVGTLVDAEQKYRDRLPEYYGEQKAGQLIKARDKAATSDKTDKNAR